MSLRQQASRVHRICHWGPPAWHSSCDAEVTEYCNYEPPEAPAAGGRRLETAWFPPPPGGFYLLVVCGLWCLWSVVCGLWSVVCGLWSEGFARIANLVRHL